MLLASNPKIRAILDTSLIVLSLHIFERLPLKMKQLLNKNASVMRLTVSYCAALYLFYSLTACSQITRSTKHTSAPQTLSNNQQPALKQNSTADYRCDVEEMTTNDDPENNNLMGIKDSWLVQGCDKKLPLYIKTGTLSSVQRTQ